MRTGPLPKELWRVVVGYVDESSLKEARRVSRTFAAACPAYEDVVVAVRGWRTMEGKRGKAALVKHMQTTVTLPNYCVLGDVRERLRGAWPGVDFAGYELVPIDHDGDVIDANAATPIWVLRAHRLDTLYFLNTSLQNDRASKLVRLAPLTWDVVLTSSKATADDVAAKLGVLTHVPVQGVATRRGGPPLNGAEVVPGQLVLYAV